MRKLMITLALVLSAAPGLAADQVVNADPALNTETYLGKTVEEARDALAGLGYDVRKSELEKGRMEFKAIKDRRKYEIEVSPETGRFLRMERD